MSIFWGGKLKGQFDVLVWEKISFCNTNAAQICIAKIKAKNVLMNWKPKLHQPRPHDCQIKSTLVRMRMNELDTCWHHLGGLQCRSSCRGSFWSPWWDWFFFWKIVFFNTIWYIICSMIKGWLLMGDKTLMRHCWIGEIRGLQRGATNDVTW